jgi:hypothetical protein
MKKLWTRHKIYLITDYVNLWTPRVTLTLERGDLLLRMTHRLNIVNNCGKYLQDPFKDKKVIDQTRHTPSNRQSWPWMSKCHLDPGGNGLVVVHDTSTYYNKYLCQVISNSFDKWPLWTGHKSVTTGRTSNQIETKDHLLFFFCLIEGHGSVFYCNGMNSIVLFCSVNS